jgi:hypothetical protein
VDLARLQPNAFTSATAELPAAALWAVVSDPLLLSEFSTELQAVRLLDEAPARLGTRFEGDQRRGERRWSTVSTVTAFEPERCFEWTVGDLASPVSRWSFLIDVHARGLTLTQRVVLCGGPSPLSAQVAAHPEQAEQVIQERLATLRERMAVTVHGLLALAGARA